MDKQKSKDDSWLTPVEYAEIWHVVPQMVRQYIWDGRIPAEKIGRFWKIPPGLEKPKPNRRYKEDFTEEEVAERVEKRRQYGHGYYMRYVEQGICFKCKKRPAAIGYTECASCRAKRNEWRDDGGAERCRSRYYRLKAAGICVSCGARPAVKGKTQCRKCRAKTAEFQQVYRIRERIKRRNQGRQHD